jgi:hypothetical protein
MTQTGVFLFPLLLLGFALFFFLKRKMIATAQSNFFGGRISPGCILFEASLLVALAAIFLVGYFSGFFG